MIQIFDRNDHKYQIQLSEEHVDMMLFQGNKEF